MGLDNPVHLMFVLVVMLLLFGAKRLPEMGRSLGEGLRGFKDAIHAQTSSIAEEQAASATPSLAAAPVAASGEPVRSPDLTASV